MIGWGFKIEKPICFILHGHSLEEFDKRIQEFKDFDVAWMSLNQWWIAQDILDKIGKKLDYVSLLTNSSEASETTPSMNGRDCPFARMFKKSDSRGCSLLELMFQFHENYADNIFLFGADGFSDKMPPYYGYKGAYTESWHNRFPEDTERFNTMCPPLNGRKIWNVSLISKYEGIPKISYDECLKILMSFKR